MVMLCFVLLPWTTWCLVFMRPFLKGYCTFSFCFCFQNTVIKWRFSQIFKMLDCFQQKQFGKLLPLWRNSLTMKVLAGFIQTVTVINFQLNHTSLKTICLFLILQKKHVKHFLVRRHRMTTEQERLSIFSPSPHDVLPYYEQMAWVAVYLQHMPPRKVSSKWCRQVFPNKFV